MAEIGEQERDISRVLEELARENVLGWLRTRKSDEIYQAIERMKKNHYHLWRVLHELYLSPDSDPSRLEEWRQAPERSQEWRKAIEHDKAIEILMIATRNR